MKNRVVVVDDNANNLMLEKDLLEVAGFEVFEAMNGADSIAMIRKEKPDVIIMDVRLPDMNGTEVVKILRQDKDTSDIPVVFVTASVLEKERREIIAILNSGYISKPIDTRTFAKEISKFIK
ncbi:response regulator [Sulfurimonas sp.]|uniref:response regulator n=1 Tax=Sulfurimonas sp. TaxID=2022749 RepID=UPI001A08AD08|nr:response regulator [Sulfurimonas sp.]MBE0514490.1 response regulator [Sulfurimonas sp.]